MSKCDVCGFELWKLIGPMRVSTLAFYDDHRFPGRAIVSLNRHYGDLLEVPDELLGHFMYDVRRAARAIQGATKCDRVNYAILMNAEAHVHAHLIPRTYATDPVPNKAPWAHPDKALPMDTMASKALILRIQDELRTSEAP